VVQSSASEPGRRVDARAGVADRLVLVTNIPTPYRTSFFDVLSEVLEEQGCGLRVLYCAEREPNRQWSIDLARARHDHRILPGLHWTLAGGYFHLNPGVGRELAQHPPRWLVVGGAWHMPTLWLAISSRAGRGASRILWSEGHADAVVHSHGAIAGIRHRVYAGFDAFAAPNARSGDYARAQAGVDRPVLPLANTVDEEYYRPPTPAEIAEARRALALGDDERVLVTVCQLVDRKAVVELASAFRALPVGAPRRRLVFIGDGERRSELERIARASGGGKIELAGHLGMSEVRRWLWAADGFVLATRSDPNPLSPIEASLCGLSLVLSERAGNVDELLVAGETGFRLDPSTVSSIGAALEPFFSVDAAALRRMGRAAALHTSARFRRRAVAERFVAALLATFPRSNAR
jgi:glycosyltransferase involved in cell wall biosynthesis